MDDEIIDCVINYINDASDRNSVSLVCKKWYELDCMTRKRLTVHLHYSPSPFRVSKRFPFIESLTLKGYSCEHDIYPHVEVTKWVRELALSFKFLKEISIRRAIVKDTDLELLARTRGDDIKVLKTYECSGCSDNGARFISRYCSGLTTLWLHDLHSYRHPKDGNWFHELALRNTNIESFRYDGGVNFQDILLFVKHCRKSLVSFKLRAFHVIEVGDAFSNAPKLEELGVPCFFEEDRGYGHFKFPPSVRCLRLEDLPHYSFPFVLPVLNQLRELDIRCIDIKSECQCFFIKKCPNLEVLCTTDICGDTGLQVISQFCKKLRKLTYCTGGTRVGLIAVAQGCPELEYLEVLLIDISNEALECVGTNLKNLRHFHFRVVRCNNVTLDNGIRSMLIGCTKLERLYVSGDLTDVGLGYIGKYGLNLRFLSLNDIGESNEGLVALSKGCPKLRKLMLEYCSFSEQAITSYMWHISSLRYIWVISDIRPILALTRPNSSARSVEAQVLSIKLKPYVILAEKLGRLAAQLIAGESGVKSVKVTYASAKAPDALDTRLLRAMVAKGLCISEERVILDGSSNRAFKSIQVQIADVKSRFASAISVSGPINVEGKVRGGVPHLTKVGGFEVDVRLEGNIILCRQADQPRIYGRVGTILGKENVNVSFMSVGRTDPRNKALMAIVVNEKPSKNALNKIGEIPAVKEFVFFTL